MKANYILFTNSNLILLYIIVSLNRHCRLISSHRISHDNERVFRSTHFFSALRIGEEGTNIKDNVRATMAENKILNVGRTSLEIEAHALSFFYPTSFSQTAAVCCK